MNKTIIRMSETISPVHNELEKRVAQSTLKNDYRVNFSESPPAHVWRKAFLQMQKQLFLSPN